MGQQPNRVRKIALQLSGAEVFGGAEFGPTGEGFYRAISGVASSFAIELNPIRVGSPADIEREIEIFARASDGGLVAAADGGHE